MRCCSDAGTVASPAYAMFSCSEELTVWCLLGRSTALSWLVACLLLKEIGHVPLFLFHYVVTLSQEFKNIVLSEVKMGLQHFVPLTDPAPFSLRTGGKGVLMGIKNSSLLDFTVTVHGSHFLSVIIFFAFVKLLALSSSFFPVIILP